MKRALLIAATIAFCQAAHAEGITRTQAVDKICRSIGFAARNVMLGRQNGLPLSVSMSKAATAAKGVQSVARGMVLAAYRQPFYESEDRKQQAVAEFENTYVLACYDAQGQANNN